MPAKPDLMTVDKLARSDDLFKMFCSWRYFDLRLRIYLRPIIKLFRLSQRFTRNKLARATNEVLSVEQLRISGERKDQYRSHFIEHGWCLIEDLLPSEFHSSLVKHWPPRCLFTPISTVRKGYDELILVTRGPKPVFQCWSEFPELKAMRDLLSSREMEEFVADLAGFDYEVVNSNFVANYSYPGSGVFPHRDGVRRNSKDAVNIIWFIDGSGAENSGGIVLSHDPDMQERIIEVENTKNTALLYNTHAPFYHGFPPICRGKYRLAFNSQFVARGQ
jgi:hypothetical protein